MSSSMSLPGLHSPAAGFEAPFDLLEACHERVHRSLALLGRLIGLAFALPLAWFAFRRASSLTSDGIVDS